jgi:integrase
MGTVHQQLLDVALERGLRESTVRSYEVLLRRLDILDLEAHEVGRDEALAALWTIDNPNTRRATVVALRAVLGLQIKIPKAIPRRYDLPDEDTLRLALMTSPHETRALLMAYAGLRIGEACAITAADVRGDRLRVDKQVQMIHRKGLPTKVRVCPVKSAEADIAVPLWLADRVLALQDTVKPDAVRESIRRAGRRVGIDLNPHQLRHWYATTALARGVPLITVSRQMRHSDVQTTLRTYAQSNDGLEIHRAFG